MNIFLLAGNYLITAWVVRLCLKERAFSLLDPAWAFLGGYFINYCIRPTLFLIDPELGSAYAGMYDSRMIRQRFAAVMAFAATGLAGFAVGNLGFGRASRKLSNAMPQSTAHRVSERLPLAWVSFCFLAAGFAGLYGFISQAGWVGTLLELLQGQRDAFMLVITGNGLYMFAMDLSLLGWAIICVYWLTAPRPASASARIWRRLLQVVWFLATLGIWVAFAERSTILAVVFIPFALRSGFRKKMEPPGREKAEDGGDSVAKPKRVPLLIAAALCFAIAGPIGLLMKGMDLSPAAAVNMSISAWDSFEFTAVAPNRVHARNLFLGSTYLGDLIYTWLPRAVFPWKPERYGSVLVQDLVEPELMENEGATFPPGILVEAFCNFGYAGLFLVPLLIGIICQAIYHQLISLNWVWLILMAVNFTNLASFRGFGGFVALLLAYGLVAYAAIAMSRALYSFRSFLLRWQPQLDARPGRS